MGVRHALAALSFGLAIGCSSDSGCPEGDLGCVCAAGDTPCSGSLVCQAGTCQQPGGTTTEGSGSSTVATISTSTTATDDSGSDGTGAASCDEGNCALCLSCLNVGDSICSAEVTDCLVDDNDCLLLDTCMQDSFIDINPAPTQCCMMADAVNAMIRSSYDALTQCRRMACPTTCTDADLLLCPPPR